MFLFMYGNLVINLYFQWCFKGGSSHNQPRNNTLGGGFKYFFMFIPYIFQLGWNHQLAPWISLFPTDFFWKNPKTGPTCPALEVIAALLSSTSWSPAWPCRNLLGPGTGARCWSQSAWERIFGRSISKWLGSATGWSFVLWPFLKTGREQRIPRNKHNMVLKWYNIWILGVKQSNQNKARW